MYFQVVLYAHDCSYIYTYIHTYNSSDLTQELKNEDFFNFVYFHKLHILFSHNNYFVLQNY